MRECARRRGSKRLREILPGKLCSDEFGVCISLVACLRVDGVDFRVINIVHRFRPLAEYLLLHDRPAEVALECSAMRLEIYRLVTLNSSLLDEKWSRLVQYAVEDLAVETTNRRMNYVRVTFFLSRSPD